ncbi:uncharacterized protein LOC123012123 [Tribolium madens]|uniref:uncharacterized protein LOC123012123 n=1 Tax=Tribolium madens TaxID=41895 RepID=UPI001CF735F9|nr:uncharacterized protein LOC123012123 [Tribolium madens]
MLAVKHFCLFKMLRITHFLFIFLFSCCLCLQDEYYWRDYTNGEVPPDAIIGGQNSEGVDIYIGQVYIPNNGLLIGEIFAGIQEVYVPIKGVKKATEGIKILCGPQQSLYWEYANNSTIHSLLVNHDAVIGGVQFDSDTSLGTVHIGRLTSHDKVGRIPSWAENPWMSFYDTQTEWSTPVYEILLYKKK